MHTIVVASQKGGSGKTALARNLAVAAVEDGQRVLILDLDPQGSLRGWWQAREADAPAMLAADPAPAQLGSTLETAAAHFDLVLVDTPPSAPGWLTDVLAAADLVLVPVRPSPDDLRAIGATLGALKVARTPFAFVLSQTPRARIVEETARVLAQHGRVAPVNIAARVAYAEAGATGQGVTETGDARGAAELRELWSYVRGVL